jgi:hypothetical protein
MPVYHLLDLLFPHPNIGKHIYHTKSRNGQANSTEINFKKEIASCSP